MKHIKHWLATMAVLLCSIAASAQTEFEVDGLKYTVLSAEDNTVSVAKGSTEPTGELTIPATVTNEDIEYSVTEIGDHAFENCTSLATIYFYSGGPIRIGTSAFEGCSGLRTVGISNVEQINQRAFYNCSSLAGFAVYTTDAALIGDEVFDGTAWYNNQPDGVVYFDDNLYKYKGEMPENTSIEIAEGTKIISANAFKDCTNLISVTIPESVTMMSMQTFLGCTNLTSITCKAVTPPSMGVAGSFNDYHYSISTLYVPAAAMSVYKENSWWGAFTNIKGIYTLSHVVDGETIQTDEVKEGAPVTHPTMDERKGYTFNWLFNEAINLKDNAETMLYTNAKCTNTQWGDEFTSWDVLFDDNDKTFFHSEYSSGVNSEDGLDHYLRVDMGEDNALTEFTFTYTVRGEIPYMANYSPKQMVVEGSNEANGEYEEITLLTDLPEEAGAVYNSPILGDGKQYRYIRFRVTETFQNQKVQEHPYFFMAEFGMAKRTIVDDSFVMPAKDIVLNGVYTANLLSITDGAIDNFSQSEEKDYAEITYTRTFNNTNWQSLYVPFDIDYDNIKEDFDVAYINDVHQFDDDDDGDIDRTQVEAIKIVSGTLDANYPYLIRAKEVGEKTITVEDAVVYATEENSIDCSSVFRNYTFTGSYNTRTAEDLPASEGYYALVDGEWKQFSESAQLGAFRVYMKIDSRVAGEEPAAAISMRVVGDESGEGTTSIKNSKADVENRAVIYDLQGRRVENPTKGIYIVNGVKRVF